MKETLNRNDHVCINATGENLAWCVNKQQKGLTGTFDHSMQDVDDLESIDIEECLRNWINDANTGDREEMRIISSDKISKEGFFEDKEDETLWLTIGTVSELETELTQEIDYQKEHHREEALEIVNDYLNDVNDYLNDKDDVKFNDFIFDGASDEVIDAKKLLQYSKNLKDDDLIQ
jgi:hypothetical protein